MTTRFAPDFTQVSAGMKIFPRGEYELTVTKVKPIAYFKKDEDGEPTDVFVSGCQVNVEMVGRLLNDGSLDRADDGESVVRLRLSVHNEQGWCMTKSSILAILGYTRDAAGRSTMKALRPWSPAATSYSTSCPSARVLKPSI